MDAKETVHNGYRFRSRLEARWAYFFDVLEVDYEYEPEGFVLSNKQSYLPDFYLPFYNVFVEVKHKNNNFISHPDDETVTFGEYTKYGLFMHEATAKGYGVWFVFGDPMDALLDERIGKYCGKGSNELFCMCLCILTKFKDHDEFKNIECECGGTTCKASECRKEILTSGKVVMIDKEFLITNFDEKLWSKSVKMTDYENIKCEIEIFKNTNMRKKLAEDFEKNFKAFIKARQKRFEFGE